MKTTKAIKKWIKKWDSHITLFTAVVLFVIVLVTRGIDNFLAGLLVVLVGGIVSYVIISRNSNKK